MNIKTIDFQNKDFENYIKSISFKKNDFVYLDPPYFNSNATYNINWNKKDEIRLYKVLDSLNKKGVRWAMNNFMTYKNKKNELLFQWAKKYNVTNIISNYKNSNYQRKNNGIDEEVLITNYVFE